MNLLDDINNKFNESSQIILDSKNLSEKIEEVINAITDRLTRGKKIIIFGNGGSAADSQHIAAELIGRFQMERSGIPAISLTTDSSILTALGNDYSNDVIFSRQCESLVNDDDVVIGISTSGNSLNVFNAIISSKKRNAFCIGLLGNDGGVIKDKVDIALIAPSSNTARIQEVHRVIYHIICEMIEKKWTK